LTASGREVLKSKPFRAVHPPVSRNVNQDDTRLSADRRHQLTNAATGFTKTFFRNERNAVQPGTGRYGSRPMRARMASVLGCFL
jgi:hypothetical protein